MRTKLVIPTILLIGAVVLSACSASVQLGQTQPQTLNVTGNAEVILAPDIAYVSIGVHSEAETAKAAVATNNSQTQAVIDAIKGQGVEDKDIKTTNFSVYQQEKFAPTGESLGIYFMADNTVYVTVRDITKIGDILDASINAGANSIYGITFDVQDKETAMASGRDQAMVDAQAPCMRLPRSPGLCSEKRRSDPSHRRSAAGLPPSKQPWRSTGRQPSSPSSPPACVSSTRGSARASGSASQRTSDEDRVEALDASIAAF